MWQKMSLSHPLGSTADTDSSCVTFSLVFCFVMAALANTLLGHPRNPIWVDGNLDIDVAGDLGSATEPRLIIVTGTLTVSANATLRGFFHANRVDWNSVASVDGALVSATSFNAAAGANATMVYNKPLLDIIRLRYGSFVRAPGGWNLF